MLRIIAAVLSITLITLSSAFATSQRSTEIVTLGNRSPSITGPATDTPKNPGENGALYVEPTTKTQANRVSKGNTFSWRRPASRKISSEISTSLPQQ